MDINNVDEAGNTLLHLAVEDRDLAEVDRLINEGANINIQNEDGETALHMAAEEGD